MHFAPAALLTLIPALAAAQTQITVTYPAPSLDRWMYPFNFSAGAEASASTFGALDQAGFDDRDAQFIVGFNTQGDITPGLHPQSYVVTAATVRLVLSAGDRWAYDPSTDDFTTYLPTTDPASTPDLDAGRPVELFAAGYRNGFNSATFLESSPFTLGSPFPPRESIRNVFAATTETNGATTDVSNQVQSRFNAIPIALGTAPLTPGTLAPIDTVLTFSIDLSSITTRAYLARSLASGSLRLVATSLSPATGGPGGGTGDPTYPAFYTKENALSPILGFSPSLDLNVTLRQAADADLDGDTDSDDVILFFTAWDNGENAADFDLDGDTDSDDVIDFFTAWDNG